LLSHIIAQFQYSRQQALAIARSFLYESPQQFLVMRPYPVFSIQYSSIP